MPSGAQLTYFAAFMGGGLFFIFIAVSIYLPFIIISPAKFAAAFTLGSSLMMGTYTNSAAMDSSCVIADGHFTDSV